MFGKASQLDLTFPLESVQDSVKKMERANWGETRTIRQIHPEDIPNSYKGRLCFNLYFIKFVGQDQINQMQITNKMIENTSEADIFYLKPDWAKYQNPHNSQFCNFLQLASDVFKTHGQNIIFPKHIL